MTDMRSRRGAAGIAPLLMIVAVLGMVGLLVWLGRTAEGTQALVVEEGSTTDSLEAASTFVTTDDLRTDPSQYEGEVIRLVEIPVASPVGTQAFFGEIGIGGVSSSPFLMRLSSDLVAQGQALPQGTVNVVGTVYVMSDSVAADWLASGTIGEGDRPLVEFATHFLEILSVR